MIVLTDFTPPDAVLFLRVVRNVASPMVGSAGVKERLGEFVQAMLDANGDYVSMTGFKVKTEHVEKRLRYYCYLNSGLKLIFNGQTFQARRGLIQKTHQIGGRGCRPIRAMRLGDHRRRNAVIDRLLCVYRSLVDILHRVKMGVQLAQQLVAGGRAAKLRRRHFRGEQVQLSRIGGRAVAAPPP